MKRTLITLSLVTLSLYTQAQEPKPASKRQVAALKQAMEERLKDADSAKYRNIQVVQARLGDVIGKAEGVDGNSVVTVMCGQVNAKNSYGGYAGFHTFQATYLDKFGGPNMDRPYAAVIGIDREPGGAAAVMCRRAGINIE